MSPQPNALARPKPFRAPRRRPGDRVLPVARRCRGCRAGGALSPPSMGWKGHRVVVTYDHAQWGEPRARALAVHPIRRRLLRQLGPPVGAVVPRGHMAQQIHDHVDPSVLLRPLGIQLAARTILRRVGPKGEGETVPLAQVGSERFDLGRIEQLGRLGGRADSVMKRPTPSSRHRKSRGRSVPSAKAAHTSRWWASSRTPPSGGSISALRARVEGDRDRRRRDK